MAGALTISTLNNDTGVLATQNGMTGIAKAWVNFTGSTAAIRSSFNISSVTRTGAGRWTVNFTNAMPNANYAVAMCGEDTGAGSQNNEAMGIAFGGFATGSLSVTNIGFAGTFLDLPTVCVSVFSS